MDHNNSKEKVAHKDTNIFLHKCVWLNCENFIDFNNEPLCRLHVSQPVSHFIGYSARAAAIELESQEVIKLLITELEKYNRDYQLLLPGYKDPSVISVLNIGKAWLDAH